MTEAGHDFLVAYDDTDASRRAAEFAAQRAAKTGEAVDVVHIGTGVTEATIEDAVGDTFENLGVPFTVRVVEVGGSEDENVSTRAKLSDVIGEHDYTVVFLGNEKRGLFHDLTEGSVSNALIEDQAVPIMLVP